MTLPKLMTALGTLNLACFATGLLLLKLSGFPPPPSLHLILAAGIMPLILGAMTYFIPVLTRTGSPESRSLWAPLTGLAGGLLAVAALFLDYGFYPIGALIALGAVGWVTWWAKQRAGMTLGRPHPGLLWYQLALGALLLGIVSILLARLWPEQWLPLRKLHLHLNILGFVGLTALGTLRVLLPTVGKFTDPKTGPWLMKEWRGLAAGTLCIAIGAAWLPALSFAGWLLWLISLWHLASDLLPHRRALLQWHGAAVSLLVSLAGLLLCLIAGYAHGLGDASTHSATEAFIIAFLLPLVTGALTHLLPMWLHKDPERQNALRERLGRYSGLRGLAFFIAAGLILFDHQAATLLAFLALAHFLLQLMRGISNEPPLTPSL